MKKNVLAKLVIGITAMSLIAGCGAAPAASDQNAEQAAADTSSAEAVEEEETAAASSVEVDPLVADLTRVTEDEAMYSRPEETKIALADYEETADVYYDLSYCGENSTDYEKLHLLIPKHAEGPYPVLVSVHGGVWSSDNSEDHQVSFTQGAALHALERGYAVACVDYSIKNEDNVEAFPLQMYEIKAAVRYLRSVAGDYQLDADHIALIGESAGGHLVNMAGVTVGDAAYDAEELGNMEYSSDVQAVVTQYSVASMPENFIYRLFNKEKEELSAEEFQALSDSCTPLAHIDGTEPPFYIEAGTGDKTVDYTQSVSLYDAMNAAGDNAKLVLYKDMDHAVSWFQSQEDISAFLDWLDGVFER